jgi:esterase/lipase
MSETKIIGLTGEEIKSQEKEQAEKARLAEEMLAKAKEQQEAYEKQLKEIEEKRFTNVEEKVEAIKTIETIMTAINSTTYIVDTELQNRKNANGESIRVSVPVRSFPVNTLESHGLRQEKAFLLDRALELLMKL